MWHKPSESTTFDSQGVNCMTIKKRRPVSVLILVLLVFAGCTSDSKPEDTQAPPQSKETIESTVQEATSVKPSTSVGVTTSSKQNVQEEKLGSSTTIDQTSAGATSTADSPSAPPEKPSVSTTTQIPDLKDRTPRVTSTLICPNQPRPYPSGKCPLW